MQAWSQISDCGVSWRILSWMSRPETTSCWQFIIWFSDHALCGQIALVFAIWCQEIRACCHGIGFGASACQLDTFSVLVQERSQITRISHYSWSLFARLVRICWKRQWFKCLALKLKHWHPFWQNACCVGKTFEKVSFTFQKGEHLKVTAQKKPWNLRFHVSSPMLQSQVLCQSWQRATPVKWRRWRGRNGPARSRCYSWRWG